MPSLIRTVTVAGPVGKDLWDKLGTVTPLISALVVGLLGIYATWLYNRRQLESQQLQRERELAVQRVQTVERFFQHLTSDTENTRRAALDTIAALGDELLAAKLADRFGGTQRIDILANLAVSTDPAAEAAALTALTDVHANARQSIVRIMCAPPNNTVTSSTGLVVSDDAKIAVPFTGLTVPPYKVFFAASGDEHDAVRIGHDASSGIAILQLIKPFPTVPIDRAVDPITYDYTFAPSLKTIMIGRQGWQQEWSTNVGTIIGEAKSPAGLERWTMKTGQEWQVGMPVFSTKGQLIGVIETQVQGIALVIPAYYIFMVVRDLSAA